MSESTKNTNRFIGYKYKNATVSQRMKDVFSDGYTYLAGHMFGN